jgi:putative FmdB family regulatory protein
MPIYDYVCEDCGTHFEHSQSFKASQQPVSCPKGHLRTKRVFSVPSIVFKGSGFYVNDRRPKAQTHSET